MERREVISVVPVTLVYIQLADIPVVSWQTLARVLANPVLACSSVATGLVSALIDV